tara:strand:+ start:2543 stop:2926 length:384 start_codon:yes stop_codon:yes gene_type:complete
MRDFLLQMKEKFLQPQEEDEEIEEVEEYVELNHDYKEAETKSKVTVRPFNIEEFEDIRAVLDSLREGHTIALINIRPLKDKDLIELKRAINKLRKTCDAIDGDIAGFGEDYIVATPYFARVHKNREE